MSLESALKSDLRELDRLSRVIPNKEALVLKMKDKIIGLGKTIKYALK
jgi:hypothetical protein